MPKQPKVKNTKPTLPDTSEWPQETETWFEAWRSSTRTNNWDQAQWQYLYDTALVHAEVWGSGNMFLIGELRQREAYMGLTFEFKPEPQIMEVRVTPLERIEARREAQTLRKSRAANKKRA